MRAVVNSQISSDLLRALKKHELRPFLLPPHPSLPAPVAAHADLLLFFASNAIYTVKSYYKIAKKELLQLELLSDKELRFCEEEVGASYPHDVLLDAAPIGNYLFCNSLFTAKELLDLYRNNVVNIRQGYAKCSCVPVSDCAAITSDPSFCKSSTSLGMDCLSVSAEPIVLPGYSNGFIGGSASYAPYGGTDHIFFCGNLHSHPDGERIIEFCENHQKNPISLTQNPLTDIGTIFLIKE